MKACLLVDTFLAKKWAKSGQKSGQRHKTTKILCKF